LKDNTQEKEQKKKTTRGLTAGKILKGDKEGKKLLM